MSHEYTCNRRKKEVEKKKQQLMQTREKILVLNDSISNISSKLAHQREKEKDFRIHTGRVVTRQNTLSIDQEKRPSDRDYGVRPYSKMDMDVWRYDQLRGWFNVYAGEPPKYDLTPSQTGYMINIE